MTIKKFKKFIIERFGSYNPIPQESPKINQYSQGTPNGMAGTSEPKNKTVAPDDQIKVGYKRFVRDFNPNKENSIIYGKREKRHWRDRRKDKRMKLNELFEPRIVDYKIIDHSSNTINDNKIVDSYKVEIEGILYNVEFITEDEFLTMDFYKIDVSDSRIRNYKELTGHNNMLKILYVIGRLYDEFKNMLITDDLDYFITDFVITPSKQDIKDNEHEYSSNTKRGKIYKYWLDSKLKNLNPTFYTDRNEMTYKFDPAISVLKINL